MSADTPVTAPVPADGEAATGGLVTAAILNGAIEAAFPGLPPGMSMSEARRRIAAALNAVAEDIASQARAEGAAKERQWQLEHGVVSVNVDVLRWWLQVLERKGDPVAVRADLSGYIGRAP